jgi:hypothetical protein
MLEVLCGEGSLERCLSGVGRGGCGRVLNVLELMLFFTALLDMVIYTSLTTSVRHGALAPQPRNLLVGRPGGEVDVKCDVRSSFPWRSGP